jgi:hypothetical protein
MIIIIVTAVETSNLTAIETFEMLKSAYGEECFSRTSVFEWHNKFKSSLERENAKIAGENNVDCIFLC